MLLEKSSASAQNHNTFFSVVSSGKKNFLKQLTIKVEFGFGIESQEIFIGQATYRKKKTLKAIQTSKKEFDKNKAQHITSQKCCLKVMVFLPAKHDKFTANMNDDCGSCLFHHVCNSEKAGVHGSFNLSPRIISISFPSRTPPIVTPSDNLGCYQFIGRKDCLFSSKSLEAVH